MGTGQGTYDYVTMGPGMAMSRPALLARNSNPELKCAAPDTFDDMQVGRWMTQAGISAVHEEGFHQARPDQYHPTILEHQDPVSFHKFAKDDRSDASGGDNRKK